MATPHIVDAFEAAHLIHTGDVVTVSGLGGNMVPEAILEALEERFTRTGAPTGLTEIHPWLYGGPDGWGLDRWAHAGLLDRIIGSTYILPSLSKTSSLTKLILEDGVAAHCWPANAIFQMLRAVGAGRTGYLTEVGIGTFADPRLDGGRLNRRAGSDLIRVVNVLDDEHLFYLAIPIDVALIRATTADTEGNLFCEEEGLTQGIRLQATAAHNSGGRVIAQVRRIIEAGSLHPLMVEVPGVMVDYLVVHEAGRQFEYGPTAGDNPATMGHYRFPFAAPTPTLPDAGRVIGRRALMEVSRGEMVNVGGGVPIDFILPVSREEGVEEEIRWSVEHGVFGGHCLSAVHWNPSVITSPGWLLDFYNGGGLDRSFLGMGQVDQDGNVNVGRLGDQLPGTGGFTDIATSTREVAFCGTMTAGGLEVAIEDGGLKIVREGAVRKFVPACDMVCFSGRQARRRSHRVTYITERAVFRLTDEGLVLVEVAPGVDVKSQVLDLADFEIRVAADLRPMDARLFRAEPIGRSVGPGPVLAHSSS